MRTICLCGSTRFADHFARLTKELSLRGHVVYTIAVAKEDGEGMTEEQKLVLDAVHMGKIANSDSVHFINLAKDGEPGYMGESTRREFYFACVMNKGITFEDEKNIPQLMRDHLNKLEPTYREALHGELLNAVENVGDR